MLAAWSTLLASGASAAETVPVMVRSAPGRFEVAARDASTAHAIVALAEETWRLTSSVLGLPDGFPTPVFVRVVDEVAEANARGESAGAAGRGFGAAVEPGGVVSLWIRWPRDGGTPALRVQRRALLHGLLLRLGVAAHGGQEGSSAPRWLETALVGWCEIRAQPAQFDAFKQHAQTLAAPALAQLFAEDPAAAEERERMIGATGLLTFLQGEATRAGEWPGFVRAVLAGTAPETALAASFPHRFDTAEQRELWWQTGWHHWRRMRSLPSLEAGESRSALAALARFVFAPDERDALLPLRTVVAHGNDAVLVAELRRRGAELARLVPALHPFYRNAGLSLAAAFEAIGAAPVKREAACAQFEQDWQDATDLEAASKAALDALEAQGR